MLKSSAPAQRQYIHQNILSRTIRKFWVSLGNGTPTPYHQCKEQPPEERHLLIPQSPQELLPTKQEFTLPAILSRLVAFITCVVTWPLTQTVAEAGEATGH